jgi:MoaA/NifB/PqqE/SkfB family radical SAM enzyme
MLADRLSTYIAHRWQKPIKAKHLRAVLRYSTPLKALNAARLLSQMRRREEVVRAYPFMLTLDTTSACNLSCPFCPTGAGTLERPNQSMSFECYAKIIDTLAPYLYLANLYNWGEPVLNKRLHEYIAYAHARRIFTSISSSFSIPLSEERIEALVRSGLDHLHLSIDGLCQDTYQQYRVGGSLDVVLANLRQLVAIRRRLRSATPFIEWNFLIFPHNRHEVPQVEAFARAKGADGVFLLRGMGPEESTLSPSEEATLVSHGKASTPGRPCDFLYHNFVVNADGGVAPCCYIHHKDDDFASRSDIESIDLPRFTGIWNNDNYRQARRQFAQRAIEAGSTLACNRCWVLQTYIDGESKASVPLLQIRKPEKPPAHADAGAPASAPFNSGRLVD